MAWAISEAISTPCLRVPHSEQLVDPKLYALTALRHKPGSVKPDLSTLIRALLLRDTDEWRIRTYLNFTITITVKASFGATPVLDGEDQIGWSAYDITLIDDDDSLAFPRTLAIVYSQGQVRVVLDRKLQHVSAYLDRLAAHVEIKEKRLRIDKPKRRYAALEKQAEWWSVNGQSFKLLELPGELRESIFQFALEGEIEVYPATAKSKRRRWRARKSEPTIGLLPTNRQVYEEASRVFYRRRLIKVANPMVLQRTLKNTRFTTRIQKLELSLNHYDFLRFFGMDRDYPEDRLVYKHRSCAGMLRNMQLTSLELRFVPPGTTTSWKWLDEACQETVVGWILEVAWEHVKGHPVALTGYIKTVQNVAFEGANAAWKAAWKTKREQYGLLASTLKLLDYDEWLSGADEDEDDGGVRLQIDTESEVKVEEITEYDGQIESWDLPARCSCKVRCAQDTWDPDS
nr:hypothetical protein B0A51_17884 [Rachicladosporium sp. CCFEE 5018]